MGRTNRRGHLVEERSNLLRAVRVKQRLHITPSDALGAAHSLVAEGAFDVGLQIHGVDREHYVRMADVAIYELRDAASAGNAPEGYPGSVVFNSHYNHAGVVTATFEVWVPAGRFERLLEASREDAELWIDFGMAADSKVELRLSDRIKRHAVELAVRTITCFPAGTTRSTWIEACRASQAQEALEELYFGSPYGGGGQVRRICEDLAAGVSRIPHVDERVEKLLAVRALVGAVRSAFRAPLAPGGDAHFDNVYDLEKVGFLRYLSQLEDNRQDELKRSFDYLWTHYSVTAVVQRGEEKYGPAKDGYRCDVGELEAVAAKYAGLGDLRSATLELILLDALVYAECIALTRQLVAQQSPSLLSVGGALKAQGTWGPLLALAKRTAIDGIAEVFKLAASFAVAWTVTGGEVTAAWVVMTGYTAWRWLRRLHLRRELHPYVRLGELLRRMTWISDSLARPDFNPGGTRHLIHTVAAEGAVFSPWVLNILDRRMLADGAAFPRSMSVRGH